MPLASFGADHDAQHDFPLVPNRERTARSSGDRAERRAHLHLARLRAENDVVAGSFRFRPAALGTSHRVPVLPWGKVGEPLAVLTAGKDRQLFGLRDALPVRASRLRPGSPARLLRGRMREITDHHANEASRAIRITCDEPSPNGGKASHSYELVVQRGSTSSGDPSSPTDVTVIRFQDGPIREVGVNGVTMEALLAILADRLRGFQSGPYACRENALALTKLEEARMWLNERTRERAARGVDGTHEK